MPIRISGDFGSIVKDAQEQIKELTAAKIVGFAITLHQELVQNTPIVTGQARAEWSMTLNEAPSESLFGDRSVHLPETVDWTGYSAAAEANVQAYQPGDVIYITNTAPYIQELNDGSSKQAPAGFIEAALATAEATLDD